MRWFKWKANRVAVAPVEEPRPSVLPKPTPYEEFSHEASAVSSPMTWKGLKVDASRALDTDTRQLSAALRLGEPSSNWSLGAVNVSESSLAVVRLDNERSIFARLGRTFRQLETRAMMNLNVTDLITSMAELQASFTPEPELLSIPTTFTGKASWQGGPVFNASVSQQLDSTTTTGGEFTLVAANGATICSIGFRKILQGGSLLSGMWNRIPEFQSPNWTKGDNSNSIKLSYVKQIDQRLSLAAVMDASVASNNLLLPETNLTVGYDFATTSGKATGSFSTNTDIAVVIETIQGLSFSCAGNVISDNYSVGIGLNLNQH